MPSLEQRPGATPTAQEITLSEQAALQQAEAELAGKPVEQTAETPMEQTAEQLAETEQARETMEAEVAGTEAEVKALPNKFNGFLDSLFAFFDSERGQKAIRLAQDIARSFEQRIAAVESARPRLQQADRELYRSSSRELLDLNDGIASLNQRYNRPPSDVLPAFDLSQALQARDRYGAYLDNPATQDNPIAQQEEPTASHKNRTAFTDTLFALGGSIYEHRQSIRSLLSRQTATTIPEAPPVAASPEVTPEAPQVPASLPDTEPSAELTPEADSVSDAERATDVLPAPAASTERSGLEEETPTPEPTISLPEQPVDPTIASYSGLFNTSSREARQPLSEERQESNKLEDPSPLPSELPDEPAPIEASEPDVSAPEVSASEASAPSAPEAAPFRPTREWQDLPQPGVPVPPGGTFRLDLTDSSKSQVSYPDLPEASSSTSNATV